MVLTTGAIMTYTIGSWVKAESSKQQVQRLDEQLYLLEDVGEILLLVVLYQVRFLYTCIFPQRYDG